MNKLGIRQEPQDWGKPFMWRGWDHYRAWRAGRCTPVSLTDDEKAVIRSHIWQIEAQGGAVQEIWLSGITPPHEALRRGKEQFMQDLNQVDYGSNVDGQQKALTLGAV